MQSNIEYLFIFNLKFMYEVYHLLIINGLYCAGTYQALKVCLYFFQAYKKKIERGKLKDNRELKGKDWANMSQQFLRGITEAKFVGKRSREKP